MNIKEAHMYVDIAAGEARGRYISQGVGQDAVYLMKAMQAKEFKAGGYTGTVPLLVAAEQYVLGGTAQEAADSIIVTEAQWIYLASEIEKIRRNAKIYISTLTDPNDITTACNNVMAILNSI